MQRAMHAWGDSRSIVSPLKVILPPVIGCTPEIALSRVVFPAPLHRRSAPIGGFVATATVEVRGCRDSEMGKMRSCRCRSALLGFLGTAGVRGPPS